MATLEQTKGYGLQERTEALMDVSRNRLNAPTPHQAPQRERVSLAGLPASAQERRAVRRRKQRPWKDTLRPDYKLGVPQLMQILEPNIVWDHVQAFNAVLSREVEAQYCPGDFFDGWHRGGRPAHGVYEGSYWELIGDCDQLMAMLEKMSQAPPLLEEPGLDLPDTADLPSWDEFKPVLQALPTAPNLPMLRLPPLRPPILDTQVPFIEPQYEVVPDVPDAPQEEPLPIFFPPEEIQVEEFMEPEYVSLEPPIIAQQPQAPVFGKPQYGHNWSGTRPFTVPLVPYQPPQLLPVPKWQHPPKALPKLPVMDELSLEEAHLDLEPLPRLELAWEAGPQPEPAYASVATTPRTLSRAPSPPRSLTPPRSATPSRPSSAVPSMPSACLPSPPPTAASTRPPSAIKRLSNSAIMSTSNSGPPSRTPSPPPPPREPSPPPAPSPPREPSPPPTQPPSPPRSISRPPSARAALDPESTPSQLQTWESVSDIDAGKPRLWMNYEAPFAELPPVFMPPEPQLGVCNGPEPQPDDYPVGDLEELPAFELPQEKPTPTWEPPALRVPGWCPPCEPRPIGFMRGTAPVLILDVSGTMNPRQRGKFPTMKECACEMLDVQGELATAAGAFDVIAFCNGAWSWSATYAQRLSLLASSQLVYSGRQVGGKVVPGSAVAKKTKAGAVLMPTEPELLADAQQWVDKWPDAVGHTSLLSALLMADEHWNADCWYILSDGLADDPMQCTEFIEARIRHGQRVPVIHAVGFFPDDVTENFEGRRFLQNLAGLTGGTFQQYDPSQQRIYKDGVGFVDYDIKAEPQEVRGEREWAEEVLRQERRKNMRLGIAERLDVTLARVQALHHQQRIQPLVMQHQDRLAKEQAAYEAAVAEVADFNSNLNERAHQAYQATVDAITARNQEKIDAAKQAYQEAHRTWVESYEQAVQEWNDLKAQKEAERQDAMTKDRADAMARYEQLQAARSRTPSPPRSRPTSARPSATNQPLTRPSSGRPPPAAPSAGSAGSRPSSATPMRSRPTSATPVAPALPALPSVAEHAAAVPAVTPASVAGTMAMASAGTHVPTHIEAGVVQSVAAQVAAAASSMLAAAAAAAAPPDNVPPGSQQEQQQAQLVSGSSNPAGSGTASRPLSSTSRPSSARPMSGSKRRSSTGTATAAATHVPAALQAGYMVNSAAVASQLQQLLEEGEDEEVEVEGQPSQLSVSNDLHGTKTVGNGQSAPAQPAGAGAQDEAYDSFDAEGLGPPPPLELEDSQELKRRIFPPEVVQALDDSNEARLADIRTQWASLLAQVEERNKAKLQALATNQDKLLQYEAAVIAAYADSFVKDAVYGAAICIAVNDRLTKAAEEAYAAEVARVQAENERLARLHTQEVEDKVYREERHKQAVSKWEQDKAAAWQQHELDVVASQQAHKDNCARLLREWQGHQEEVRQMNEVRLSEAQAHHAVLVEEVAAANRKTRAEHAEKVKARKAVEAENLARLAEAKARHQQALADLLAENEAKLLQAQEDHQALCVRLEQEHKEAVEAAHREFAELKSFLAAHNEGLLEEARKRYGEAVAAAQAEHATLCEQLRAAHAEELAQVTAHNEAIWPQVQRARLALEELGRVQAFAEHIRFCANKLQLGVNFMPNTPNYDRVVEMQALNEALAKAFPDYNSRAYPWPGHEERFKPGTGWVPSPAPPALDLKDPAIEINKIVASMTALKSKTRGARPTSARPTTSPPALPATASGVPPLMRPTSASRSRFSSVAAAAFTGMPTSPTTPAPSTMTGRPGSGTGQAEVWDAGGGYSILHTTVSAGNVSTPSRPSTPSSRALAAAMQTAPGSLAGSPRPGTAKGRAAAQTRALSAGPTVSAAPANAMLSAPSMADAANQPASPAALAKGLGVATNEAAASPTSGARQAARMGSRPASARMPVPARMSAELQAMQATINKYRTPKMFAAPAVQQKAQKGSVLGGKFRADYPRALWPDVDVKALELQ